MNWYEKLPTTALAYGYGAALDTARLRTVFFGGFNTSSALCNTTVEWRGGNASVIATAHSPAARSGLAMAYDQARALTTLFGGFTGPGTPVNDTWVYDGADWTALAPVHKPSHRSTAMVYDPVHDLIILQGGSDGTSQLSDTWAWGGSDWTQLAPVHSPPGCGDGVMLAWDPVSEKVVFFGGGSPYTNVADTYTWDGTDWTAESPATSPPGRRYGAMGGIAGLGVVLYGGFQQGVGNLYDLWLWNGSDWSDITGPLTPSQGLSQLDQALPEEAGAVTPQPLFIVHGEFWDWTPYTTPVGTPFLRGSIASV